MVEGFPRFPVFKPARSGPDAPWWAPPSDEEIERTVREVKEAMESPHAQEYRRMIERAQMEMRIERIEELVEEEMLQDADRPAEARAWWEPPTASEINQTVLEVRSALQDPRVQEYRRLIERAQSRVRKERVEQLLKELEEEG